MQQKVDRIASAPGSSRFDRHAVQGTGAAPGSPPLLSPRTARRDERPTELAAPGWSALGGRGRGSAHAPEPAPRGAPSRRYGRRRRPSPEHGPVGLGLGVGLCPLGLGMGCGSNGLASRPAPRPPSGWRGRRAACGSAVARALVALMHPTLTSPGATSTAAHPPGVALPLQHRPVLDPRRSLDGHRAVNYDLAAEADVALHRQPLALRQRRRTRRKPSLEVAQ
jgi:hypothetical protein